MLYREKNDRVPKFLLLITVFTAYFGSTLSIKGLESLFAYRVFLALTALAFLISFFSNHRLDKVCTLYRYYTFLIIWVVWAIASVGWAQNRAGAIRGIFLLACNVLTIFFISYYINDEKSHRQLWLVFYSTFAISMAVALWEIATTHHLAVSKMNTYTPPRQIPTAFYANPNDLAAYIVMYISLIYAAFKYEERNTIVKYMLCVAGVFALLYTNSRASYIAFLLAIASACALAVIDIIKKSEFFSNKAKMKSLLMLITVIVMLIFNSIGFGWFKNTPGNPAMIDQIGNISEVDESGSTQVRINLIKNGFKVLNEKTWQYITGIGAGNTEARLARYASTTDGIVNMHNWWMEILLEYGIIIAALFIWFYLSIIWNLFKIYLNSPSHNYKMFAEGLLLSLIVFFMASISPSSIRGMPALWIVFGQSLAFIKLYKENVEGKHNENIDTISHVSKSS